MPSTNGTGRSPSAPLTRPSYQTADGAPDLANNDSYERVGGLSCNAIRRANLDMSSSFSDPTAQNDGGYFAVCRSERFWRA